MTSAEDIVAVLREAGPMTGAQLQDRTGLEILDLWTLCHRTPGVRLERFGRRFLRLDRTVEGYARLSPSIRREFQTYTVLALDDQQAQAKALAGQLLQQALAISRRKLELARRSIEEVLASLAPEGAVGENVGFFIAGDVIYGMAHDVPRPEQSTGEMVRGSDLDVIAVADESLPAERLKELDTAIFKKKHFLLVHPDFREEIDYVVKDMAAVREQVAFDTFERMVACKILDEGQFLCGSLSVFRRVKELVREHGLPERLAAMEEPARRERERAEQILLRAPAGTAGPDVLNLFYTREESEEIY